MNLLRAILPKTGLDETARRFPLSILFSFLAFMIYIMTGEGLEVIESNAFAALTILYCVISYFWCGAATLITESQGYSKRKGLLLTFAGCVVILPLVFVFGILDSNILWLFPVLLLLIMVAPFLSRRDDNAYFWQYNCILWTGALNAFFSALILYLGLIAALSSVNYLFGFKFVIGYYAHILAFCSMVVAPVYALFWVPRRFDAGIDEIHNSCRILVNWILVPLMVAYLIIFYVYFAKIMVDWDLPKGKLSSMIAGLGCLGVIIYMTAWPMVRGGTRLLGFLHRNFFKLMLIPMLMMGVALSYRIHQYGITEQRYMLLLVLLWFGIISGFFLLKKDVPLKAIPIVLMTLMLVASTGPMGAMSVSGRSQSHRLEEILIRNGILSSAGEIVLATDPVSFKDQREISSILDYMSAKRFRRYLPVSVSAMIDTASKEHKREGRIVPTVMKAMGLEYKSKFSKAPNPSDGEPFSIALEKEDLRNRAIPTKGYQYVVDTNLSMYRNVNKQKQVDGAIRTQQYLRQGEVHEFKTTLRADGKMVLVVETFPELIFNLDEYVRSGIKEGYNSKVKEILVTSSGSDLKAELFLRDIRGFVKGDVVNVTHLNGKLTLYFR